ncbi:hypothetical protein B0T18DRAFT_165909 [Schizothecium vesticola]|uniref:Uncharacterized protein n=1 Tax=Schizothecium vesticola TaxID=314040 RepID=A0AA40EXH9_9PEZI|nr:hypothetical protein B0T18DRAFT_165909 [Schizothecium vesticola]
MQPRWLHALECGCLALPQGGHLTTRRCWVSLKPLQRCPPALERRDIGAVRRSGSSPCPGLPMHPPISTATLTSMFCHGTHGAVLYLLPGPWSNSWSSARPFLTFSLPSCFGLEPMPTAVHVPCSPSPLGLSRPSTTSTPRYLAGHPDPPCAPAQHTSHQARQPVKTHTRPAHPTAAAGHVRLLSCLAPSEELEKLLLADQRVAAPCPNQGIPARSSPPNPGLSFGQTALYSDPRGVPTQVLESTYTVRDTRISSKTVSTATSDPTTKVEPRSPPASTCQSGSSPRKRPKLFGEPLVGKTSIF